MQVGFTGTQRGMTIHQLRAVRKLLRDRVTRGRHGMCIGSDEQFHSMCLGMHIPVIGHPPIDTSKMMQFNPREFVRILPQDEYLRRNHAIVDASDIMIATPYEHHERLRSGTWATIRYAVKVGKPRYIVLPDGRVGFFKGDGKKGYGFLTNAG